MCAILYSYIKVTGAIIVLLNYSALRNEQQISSTIQVPFEARMDVNSTPGFTSTMSAKREPKGNDGLLVCLFC
jgi:hypothetical protein